MRTMLVAGGFLVTLLMTVSADAQVVGAPVDLPIAAREMGVVPTAPDRIYLEGLGSDIGATVRGLRVAEVPAGKLRHGVVVESVSSDGPAARAGVKVGDILMFGAAARTDANDKELFARLVRETPPGRAVPVVVMRNGAAVAAFVIAEQARASSLVEP
jgi:hypothetical protein